MLRFEIRSRDGSVRPDTFATRDAAAEQAKSSSLLVPGHVYFVRRIDGPRADVVGYALDGTFAWARRCSRCSGDGWTIAAGGARVDCVRCGALGVTRDS